MLFLKFGSSFSEVSHKALRRPTALTTGALAVALWIALVLVQGAQAASQEDRARQERDVKYEEYVRELESSPTTVVTYEDLLAAVRGYEVTVLGGYSGLGYEHPNILREQIFEIVRRKGDKSVYVLGGTEDGIGQAYRWIPELAQELRLGDIKTAGIVSRNAAAYGVADQDYIVFVDTSVDEWEVVVNGRSLMVDVAQQTGGELIYFRGGAVAKAEIEEAVKLGVPVTLYTGDGLAPSTANVAKRLEKDPDYVTDGTRRFVDRPPPNDATSPFTVITVDPNGRVVPRD